MINDEAGLRELYPEPKERARRKLLTQLDTHCRRFIELSPFLVMATADVDGRMDASPRGGAPGFVRVLDEQRLLLPDASGNNLLDSLRNITATGRLGLVFFVPGVDETLRVNGRVAVTVDEEHLALWPDERRPPRAALLIDVEEAYLHCAKALMRSRLWAEESRVERSELPTMARMLADQQGSTEPIESQADMVRRYEAEL